MKQLSMKTLIFLSSALIFITALSCSHEEEATDLQSILDSIEENGDNLDIEKLQRSLEGMEGIYEVGNPEAKFSITFPVMNVKNSVSIQLINGEEIEIHHYSANMQRMENDNLAYQIDYVFLPEVKTNDDVNKLFDEQRDYVLSATNSKLEFEKVIDKFDAAGRHLYFTVDESDWKTNYKMFFKDGIFYKLSVVTKNGKLFNKSSKSFFDSFKILD